jgi:dihydroorotate dehydrogenase
LRTFRPAPGGWINAIGLRNSGLESAPKNTSVSLAPIEPQDWEIFDLWLGKFRDIEFNLGCPNIDGDAPLPPEYLVARTDVTWKVPPGANDLVDWLAARGARSLHLSNALPSPRGGISGAQLRAVNLPFVASVARRLSGIEITAGGGVYAPEHAQAYRDLGATRVSLATAFMWPPRAFRILTKTDSSHERVTACRG